MNVSTKKDRITSRIVSMIIGIALGVLMLVLGSILTEATVDTIIKWGLIIYGIVIIIGNVPGLVSGILNIRSVQGIIDLVFSVLGIALGIVLICYHGTVLVGIVAAYMIVFPVLRILLAKQKMEQFKRELVRIVLGVVLMLFVPSLVGAATAVIKLLLLISGVAVTLLTLVFGIVEIVRLARTSDAAPASGSRVYVDVDGDGNIDTVIEEKKNG